MLIAQATVSVLVDFTRVSLYGYFFLKFSTLTTLHDRLVAVFIFQFSNILLYFNYSKSFYIYTLTSRFFRQSFYANIQKYYRKLLFIQNRNQVHPIT